MIGPYRALKQDTRTDPEIPIRDLKRKLRGGVRVSTSYLKSVNPVIYSRCAKYRTPPTTNPRFKGEKCL